MMLQDPNYWDNYVWANQLDREFYLMGTIFSSSGNIPRWGSVENGFNDMLHYTPEHVINGSQGPVDYRVEAQTVIDTIATMISQIGGNGQTPYNMLVVLPEDSMQAINNGNTFDFSYGNSYLLYIDKEEDRDTGIWYINRAGEAIKSAVSFHSELRRIMAHELGRAVGYNGLTPYDPEHPENIDDIMGGGQLQPHDFYGYYFAMNANPYLYRNIKNIEEILPNSFE